MKTDSRWKMILGVQVVGWFVLICIIYGTSVFIKRLVYERFAHTSTWNKKIEVAAVQIENIEVIPKRTENAVTNESTIVEKRNIVYDNMTMEELSAKLDRSLNSTLAGKGYLFAKNALELGVDPYLAVAIVLEETGCKWNCSSLVKQCNNVGGQKGGTIKCNGGSYRYYSTLEEGIYGFVNNLARNYYAKGLTTPEQINPRYAASTAWASKINNYIAAIKAA